MMEPIKGIDPRASPGLGFQPVTLLQVDGVLKFNKKLSRKGLAEILEALTPTAL